MRRRRLIALALLVLAVDACARTHLPTSFEVRDAAGSERARGGDAATGDAGASNVPGKDAAAGTPVATDATAGDTTEVWIGQLWSVSPLGVCDPNAPWMDTPVVVQPMGYINRVVLIVENSAGTQLRGRIQLGEGALPTSPGNAPYATSDGGSYWLCSIQLPTKGVEYQLLDPVLSSDRLMFEISPSAVWDTFCAGQGSRCPGAPDGGCPPLTLASTGTVCTCENGSCKATEHERVAFDLAVTASTVEGELSALGGGFGTPAELRLRRVQ